MHAPQPGLTMSTRDSIGYPGFLTHFSLGTDTDISAERYPNVVMYLCSAGLGTVDIDGAACCLHYGEAIVVPELTLCATSTHDGFVYTEIVIGKESKMNEAVSAGTVFKLADLVPYQEDSIVNMDVVKSDLGKFVVMSFDSGCALGEHSAPGDALVFALEGKGVIRYEGVDYPIAAGENFRFEKGGMHSVRADGRFKMALLIALR